MITAGMLIPLKAGTILSAASKELDQQILALVPEGKHGAVVTIVDREGVRIGLAATYKGTVTVTLEAHKGWTTPPTASLKLKVIF